MQVINLLQEKGPYLVIVLNIIIVSFTGCVDPLSVETVIDQGVQQPNISPLPMQENSAIDFGSHQTEMTSDMELETMDMSLDQGLDLDQDISETLDMENVDALMTCVEGMDCLMECDAQDDACHQECIDHALHDAKAELRGVKRCIDQNECTDQKSIFTHCAYALLACEDVQGQNNCADTQSCLQDCGEDAFCGWHCANAGDEAARLETISWSRCLVNQGCNMLSCDECLFDQTCQDMESNPSPIDIHSCSGLVACIDQCHQDFACEQNCKTRSQAQVLEVFEELDSCVQQAGCHGDHHCRSSFCTNQALACGLILAEVNPNNNANIQNCMELNNCVEDCNGVNACMMECESQASQEARLIYNQLKSCIIVNQCTTRQCLTNFCYDEAYLCAFH